MQISKPARYLLPLFLVAASAATPPTSAPVFPEGYRNWFHVKSATIGSASPAFARFGGLHNIYANPEADRGLSSGAFPEGSVLVFDVLEARESPNGVEPVRRRQLDVMYRDRRFAASGGWGFAEFGPEATPAVRIDFEQGERQCAACHATAPGGVFSRPL